MGKRALSTYVNHIKTLLSLSNFYHLHDRNKVVKEKLAYKEKPGNCEEEKRQ